MSEQAASPQAGPGHGRAGLLARLVVLALLATGLWWTAPATADRFLTATLVVILAVGLIAEFGAPRGQSRLPAVVQGLAVGLALGVAGTLVVTGRLEAWGVLAALLALPSLFPAVVPRRWRSAVILRWSDLADQRAEQS